MMNAVSSLDMALGKVGAPTGAAPVRAAEATPISGAGAPASADFMDVLAQVSSSAVTDLRAGEAAAISGLKGKMSVQQVVEAVMSAEKSLQTALAVRDKVVNAYQEISRMAI